MVSSDTGDHKTPQAEDHFSANEGSLLLLADISNALKDLNGAFAMLNGCADKFNDSPSHSVVQQGVEASSLKIIGHEHDTDVILEGIKSKFKNDIKQEVAASMLTSQSKATIADILRDEVKRQVKEQVDEQISEHLPQSLQQQADESKRQLEDIRISLQNSEARMANSFVETNNLLDPLAPLLTAKGEKSPYYPWNAQSLFTYDLDSVKELSKYYELTESDDLQLNFKQFLKHIGTKIDVLVPEAEC